MSETKSHNKSTQADLTFKWRLSAGQKDVTFLRGVSNSIMIAISNDGPGTVEIRGNAGGQQSDVASLEPGSTRLVNDATYVSMSTGKDAASGTFHVVVKGP